MEKATVQPQRVKWTPDRDGSPGIIIMDTDEFIPWRELKPEIEKQLILQVRKIPIGSTIEIGELYGRKDWTVKVIDPDGKEIAHVWFGGNANKAWEWDGRVRIGDPQGDPVVWQGFERYPNGTYCRVENFI